MAFPKKKRLSKEQSAARVLAVFVDNLGKTMTIRQLAKRTNMSVNQVGRGERHLKEFLNERGEEMPEWTLHIGLNPRSEHGLIADSDATLLDVVSRLLYMANRSVSELNYREQAIARVADPVTRKHLKRGVTYQRAAREAYADAYERMT